MKNLRRAENFLLSSTIFFGSAAAAVGGEEKSGPALPILSQEELAAISLREFERTLDLPSWSEVPKAQNQEPPPKTNLSAVGGSQLDLGIGFTDDPDSFLMAFGFAHYFENNVALGPKLYLGLDDDFTLFAPAVELKVTFDLPGNDPVASRLRPFVHAGPGFAYIQDDDLAGDDDELGFMAVVGFGVDYQLRDRISIGTDLSVHYLPTEVLGEHSFFTWQVLTFTLHF